jgi:hypothetical protein
MTRLMLGLKDLLLGGVGDIETILVRGERLPSWKEVGFAALDVTIVAGGVGAVAKVARVGVGAAEVIEKRLRFKEEVRITKRLTTEFTETPMTVRKQRAVIERLNSEGASVTEAKENKK